MDDYPEPASSPSLAKGLGKLSTSIRIHADVNSSRMGEDSKWRKDEHKRLKAEIAAVKKMLANWDPEAVAAQAKKSVTAELAVKQARLLECEAQMDLDGIKYGGADEDSDEDYEVEGNPYAVKKDGDKWLVVKADTGKKVAEHATKAKAMAQFRLLEGVEHGWEPTGKK